MAIDEASQTAIPALSTPAEAPATEPARPRPVRELLLVAALYLAYRLGRLVAEGHVSAAYGNAADVWTLERDLHLPDEATVQRLLLYSEPLVRATNTF
ncbi:hypothetical protein [Actinacidiphila soli]|uniref:hypothetical protein n=1 Tax=Actinacidiphila soli TaxID=2487275 RepID=UPI00389929B7